jgi:phosphatidylglycerophosphate synthase
MLAICITLSRLPLLVIWVLLLYLGSPPLRLAGVALLFVGLMLDTVDGIVARRTGRTSLFGGVLDIAADRTYELVLWVCFANLGMIPSVIPLIIIARTTLTDALRSLGVAEGTAPFAQPRSAVARFLVGSPLMRTGYSVTKLMAFCGLALAEALAGFPAGATLGISIVPMLAVLQVIAWSAVIFCVCRGLPVLVGGIPRLRDA